MGQVSAASTILIDADPATVLNAIADYQEAIERGHALRTGREELERTQARWAERYQVEAQDAAVLGELARAERQPREVQRALEACGVSLAQVQEAVDRLYVAGLIAPVGRSGPLPRPGEEERHAP